MDLVSLAKARAMKPFKLNRTGSRVKSVYIYIYLYIYIYIFIYYLHTYIVHVKSYK